MRLGAAKLTVQRGRCALCGEAVSGDAWLHILSSCRLTEEWWVPPGGLVLGRCKAADWSDGSVTEGFLPNALLAAGLVCSAQSTIADELH